MNPLVSIIVPVYNVEEFLKECVDSIVSQSYSNLEIILVDDGSTDKSGAMCDEFAAADSRIKVIHKKNGGLSAARNSGTDIATGDYYYYIDSDDYILKETVEELVNKALETDADIVFFDAFCFYEDDCKGKRIQHYIRSNNYESNTGLAVFNELVKNNEYHASVSLIFIKSSFVKEINLTYSLDTIFVDMIYTYEAFSLAKKVSYINKQYYQRRYRADSLITSKVTPRKYYSAKVVYDNVLAFSEKNNLLNDEACKKYIIRCASNVLNYFDDMPKEDRTELKAERKASAEGILSYKAFDNKALEMMCHSKLHWFVYKVIEKILRK